MELKCKGYSIDRFHDSLVEIKAVFILPISPTDSDVIAEALKKIEIFLSGSINLVKAVPDKQRCFYCATLNESDNNLCSQCGAPL